MYRTRVPYGPRGLTGNSSATKRFHHKRAFALERKPRATAVTCVYTATPHVSSLCGLFTSDDMTCQA
eukprot:6475360-Amphidinium_carterae.1